MDTQILEWVTQQAEDWWTSQRSHVYVWGKGHWNVIGHSGRERILPTLLDEWKDVRMVRITLQIAEPISGIIFLLPHLLRTSVSIPLCLLSSV